LAGTVDLRCEGGDCCAAALSPNEEFSIASSFSHYSALATVERNWGLEALELEDARSIALVSDKCTPGHLYDPTPDLFYRI
jgi:hypothetical protein